MDNIEVKCLYCGLPVGINIFNGNIANCQYCDTEVTLPVVPNIFLERSFGVSKNSKWRTKVILNGREITKLSHGGTTALALPVGEYKIDFRTGRLIKTYEFQIKDGLTRVHIEVYTGKYADRGKIIITESAN
jgi:hypothetical protein